MNTTCRKTTIRKLINSIKEVMIQNPTLNWDSEILLSDINMSFFEGECKVLPTYDYKSRNLKLGIYIIPENEFIENSTPTPVKVKANGEDTAWLNKYKG